ncbi:hypothetical protein COU59_01005 [Candidatus Pacearchaeota archaeon CG10_big_fil_rev_8_21_14_0_10_34_12]|nr:MAG: hypothetical protein COU59_01005 [Candidatus Pacearchaeota archaeon CG10_big_fil_rev_8_21_14_0_10_34_12]
MSNKKSNPKLEKRVSPLGKEWEEHVKRVAKCKRYGHVREKFIMSPGFQPTKATYSCKRCGFWYEDTITNEDYKRHKRSVTTPFTI